MDDENMFIPDIPRSTSPESFGKDALDEEGTLPRYPSTVSKPDTSRRKRRRAILPFHRSDVANGLDHLTRLMHQEKEVISMSIF